MKGNKTARLVADLAAASKALREAEYSASEIAEPEVDLNEAIEVVSRRSIEAQGITATQRAELCDALHLDLALVRVASHALEFSAEGEELKAIESALGEAVTAPIFLSLLSVLDLPRGVLQQWLVDRALNWEFLDGFQNTNMRELLPVATAEAIAKRLVRRVASAKRRERGSP